MKKKKIIIDIIDETSEESALTYVKNSVQLGRISKDGTSYCSLIEFEDGTIVTAERIKNYDNFRVMKGR